MREIHLAGSDFIDTPQACINADGLCSRSSETDEVHECQANGLWGIFRQVALDLPRTTYMALPTPSHKMTCDRKTVKTN